MIRSQEHPETSPRVSKFFSSEYYGRTTNIGSMSVTKMRSSVAGLLLGIPENMPSRKLISHEPDSTHHHTSHSSNGSSEPKQKNLGPKITESVKRKMSLGTKILQTGGITKFFKQNFSTREGEKLEKVFQCYLSTTAGPIAGFLFISIDKVAFCSDRSIKISSEMGEAVKIRYKVVIPLRMIRSVSESKNVNKPSKKYMEIVTVDDFDFWFMGFHNYQRTFKYLRQAVSQTP